MITNGAMLQALKLNIISIGFARLGTEWDYTDVYGPFHRLYLVTGGEGIVQHHGQEFHLLENVLHLVPAYTPSGYHCDSFLEILYVHFSCELEDHFDLFSEMPFQYQLEAGDPDQMLFERLLELNPGMELKEYDPKKYDQKLHFQRRMNYANDVPLATFLESKAIMLRYLSEFINPELQQADTREHPYIEKTIRFISENESENLTVSQLADIVSLTPDHFSKIFKKTIGVRPIEYIHRKRLQRVKLLLLTTDLSVAQIAEQVGFSSSTYLLRIFRKHTGVTLMQYRKAAHYC